MKVFRVELDDGLGPYISKFRIRSVIWKHCNEDVHPVAIDDCEERDDKDYCGFDSIDKFHNWFNDCISELRLGNAKLKTYEIDNKYVKLGKSGKQLLFVRAQAKLIKEEYV